MNDLKPKTIKNRVRVLKAIPYKNCMVYIRMIGTDLFMYDVVYGGQIYSSNIVISPKKGQVKLTPNEIQSCIAIIWAGAVATIDTLLGTELSPEVKAKAQAVLDVVESDRDRLKSKYIN